MKKILTLLTTTALLTGCGGGSTSETVETVETAAVSGHVSGAYGVEESIGAGATVNLIQIDTQGNQVGSVIVTTSTDVSGNYTLNIPTTYSASTNYTITANDGTKTISAIWTGSTTDVNVITDAATTLLFNSSSPASSSLASYAAAATSDVNISEVKNCIDVVSDMSENGSNKVQNVQDNQEAFDQCDSAWGAYIIKGKVTDSTGTPIEGVKIFARDFNNKDIRSSIKTDANGDYVMNIKLQIGYGDKMIVGAMNRTATNTAASEFYTDGSPVNGSGTKCYKPHCGDSVTISETTPQVLDFQLAAGSRITGAITGGANNTKLKRVKIRFRDSVSRRFRGAVRSDANGIFNFNIQPGSYIAYIINDTDQQYGSVAWTSDGGHVDRNYGEIFTVAAGDTKTLNINLEEGGTIEGFVCNSQAACPSTSGLFRMKKIKVLQFSKTNRFNKNMEFDTDTLRTDNRSGYKVQLPYGKYRFIGNGKSYDNSGNYYTIDASNKTLTLDINHATTIAKVKVIDSNGDPLTDIGVRLKNYVSGTSIGSSTFSDGTAQIDVDTSSSSKFYFQLTSKDGQPVASCNYDGANCSATALKGKQKNDTEADGRPSNSDIVDYTRDIALNADTLTLQMPAGFAVTGTITGTDGTAAANASPGYSVKDTLKDDSEDWRWFTGTSTGSDGKYSMSLADNTNYHFKSTLDDDTRIEFRGPSENGCSITAASTKDFDYTNASSTGRYRFNDCTFTTPAMPHTISGSVTDHNGATLAKALVRIDIRTISDDTLFRRIEAITDDNGGYSIKVPEDSSLTYYYKFKAYYDLVYNVTGYWDNNNYIEYGKNKNCGVSGNKIINFNAVTASLDGTDDKKYTTCQ